jgi:hypothetical protein
MFELNYPLRQQKRSVSAATSPEGRGSKQRRFIDNAFSISSVIAEHVFISAFYKTIPRFCL